jgi:hypothetical protein
VIAFPIPGADGLPPIVGVLLVIAATAGFVVLLVQAVRYFRNSNGGHDVFGPDVPPEKGPDDGDPATGAGTGDTKP